MFSSAATLKKRTPEGGIGRGDYIEHLVEEFHTTKNIEAQEQVLANLANFAYDPINYKFLKSSCVLDVFVQCLEHPNERIVSHAIGGITNFCLDPEITTAIVDSKNLEIVQRLFVSTNNVEVLINCVTLFYLLLTADVSLKSKICAPQVVQKASKLKESDCVRLSNISKLFVTDFCTRQCS